LLSRQAAANATLKNSRRSLKGRLKSDQSGSPRIRQMIFQKHDPFLAVFLVLGVLQVLAAALLGA
jgi:hypothetical protein